jgi:crotonobetainyl-CoA:carnitine CoA-transferase CaiB-like acyl-CoA transferase
VLKDVRVLDLGRYIAGPYCATLLGYFGADVIRVERPGGGEDRFVAPVTEAGEGGSWLQMGVNKRSVTLSLGQPDAKDVLARLVRWADVVVVNLPPPALVKLGLDEQSLRTIKPEIIVISFSSFGSVGPWSHKGGFDGVGQAMSGAMHFSGVPGQPMKAAAPYVDFGTAMFGALGALAALIAKARDGKGQNVQASLLGTALSFFNAFLIEEGLTGIDRAGSGNRVQTSGPSDVFRTRDGHILIHVVGNGLFKRCATMVGEASWLDDPRFASDDSRGKNNELLCAALARWCEQRTTDEALTALDAAGVPAGPVLSARQTLEHPQVQASSMLGQFEVAGSDKRAPIAQPPVKLSRTPASIRTMAPSVGEHTDHVLAELGYDEKEISRLKKNGIV